MKTSDWVVVVLLASIAVLAINVIANIISEDFQLYVAESECVADYIESGHERRDIITENGICYLARDKNGEPYSVKH